MRAPSRQYCITSADAERLLGAITQAETFFEHASAAKAPCWLRDACCSAAQGYIVQKVQKKAPRPGDADGGELIMFGLANHNSPSNVRRFDEFHPFLPLQHAGKPLLEFATFDRAVDAFFSQLESQKLDLQAIQQVRWRPCMM